jgi:hypothetical protein
MGKLRTKSFVALAPPDPKQIAVIIGLSIAFSNLVFKYKKTDQVETD